MHEVHRLINVLPWEMSPCMPWEMLGDEPTREDLRGTCQIFLSSWWRTVPIKRAIEQAVAASRVEP